MKQVTKGKPCVCHVVKVNTIIITSEKFLRRGRFIISLNLLMMVMIMMMIMMMIMTTEEKNGNDNQNNVKEFHNKKGHDKDDNDNHEKDNHKKRKIHFILLKYIFGIWSIILTP